MRNVSLNRIGICLLAAITALALFSAPSAAAPLRQEGDPQAQAETNFDAGWTYANAGDYAAALQEFEQALSLYQAANDRKGEANALLSLG